MLSIKSPTASHALSNSIFVPSTILSFLPSLFTSIKSKFNNSFTAIPATAPTAVPNGGRNKEPTAAPAALDVAPANMSKA